MKSYIIQEDAPLYYLWGKAASQWERKGTIECFLAGRGLQPWKKKSTLANLKSQLFLHSREKGKLEESEPHFSFSEEAEAKKEEGGNEKGKI